MQAMNASFFERLLRDLGVGATVTGWLAEEVSLHVAMIVPAVAGVLVLTFGVVNAVAERRAATAGLSQRSCQPATLLTPKKPRTARRRCTSSGCGSIATATACW